MLLHIEVLIHRTDFDTSRQCLIHPFVPAISCMADDTCTHHLSSIANNERIAKVLIYLHLQPVGFLIRFLAFTFVATTVFLVFLLATQGCSSRSSAYDYATNNTWNEVLLRTLLVRCIMVFLHMQTIAARGGILVKNKFEINHGLRHRATHLHRGSGIDHQHR